MFTGVPLTNVETQTSSVVSGLAALSSVKMARIHSKENYLVMSQFTYNAAHRI